jgi:hypothetical protein
VSLEVERAVLRAPGIERVLACETEVIETAARAEELGVLAKWRDNPRRLTWTNLLLKGAHGGEVSLGLEL